MGFTALVGSSPTFGTISSRPTIQGVETDEYILGTDAAELLRLEGQHEAWASYQVDVLQKAGIREGDHVLDLGCGPGFTTMTIADLVGPGGCVVGRDISERFLATLTERARAENRRQVAASQGAAEEHDDALGTFDIVYARWVLCWVRSPRAAIEASLKYLKPGGRLVFQEYVDWGATRLLPHSPAIQAAVEACMRSWEEARATIDVARTFPVLADELGLRLTHFAPLARLAAASSPAWNWIRAFFDAYVPKLVAAGLITHPKVEAMRRDWAERTERGLGHCYTPVLSDAIFERA